MTDFMRSGKYARVLAGPIGGGKSVCCVHELMHWAAEQRANKEGVRKTRFLIVRNTMDQLKMTTMKTVFDWLPTHTWGDYRSTEKTYTIMFALPDGTRVRSEWMFISLDDENDVRKALSLECTGVWCNEARELKSEIIEALLSRTDRYPSMREGGATRAGGIFDTNMPIIETWWHERMENPPENWSVHTQPPAILSLDEFKTIHGHDPEEGILESTTGDKFVVNPAADNLVNLSPNYYPNNIPGKTDDWIGVYLRCKYGQLSNGLPVFAKTFIPTFHESLEPLRPVRSENYPIVVGMDFGRTPAAVFLQLNPRGQILGLSEVTSENMGLETFIDRLLRPHIMQYYAGFPLLIAPDPAGFDKTQRDEVTLVDVLRMRGFRISKPPTNRIEPRLTAVERVLARQVEGKPGFLIDRAKMPVVSQAFRFGYKWPLTKAGVLQDNSPLKNSFSHPMDALQYGVLVMERGAMGGSAFDSRPSKQPVKPAPYKWA
jgi:hypothetical protein